MVKAHPTCHVAVIGKPKHVDRAEPFDEVAQTSIAYSLERRAFHGSGSDIDKIGVEFRKGDLCGTMA